MRRRPGEHRATRLGGGFRHLDLGPKVRIRWWHHYNGSTQLDLLLGGPNGGGYALRFGLPELRPFTERYQGTRGIPKRYWYAFGGRLAFIKFIPREGS